MIGQSWPTSGGSGGGEEEVLIQASEPATHPNLWVDVDDDTGSEVYSEVAIQTAEPAAHLDLWVDTDADIGTVVGNPRVIVQVSTTSALSATAKTDFVYQATAAPITLTLPSAIGNTNLYVIKNTASSGTVTVATIGGQTIDGASTYPLASQYDLVNIVSNNTNWIVI